MQNNLSTSNNPVFQNAVFQNPMFQNTVFQNPNAARAGGYVLLIAGLLVAVGLWFHPLPDHGFLERVSTLSSTPWWGVIHVAIAGGFVLCMLGSLLVLVAGRRDTGWFGMFNWGAITVGMNFFTGVSLINGYVMHPLTKHLSEPGAQIVFDAMNNLLVGYGWLGNPLFLLGLTGVTLLEALKPSFGLPRWFTIMGFIVTLLSWLRGVGSATGLYFLEFFIFANIPAFVWFAVYGAAMARWIQVNQRLE